MRLVALASALALFAAAAAAQESDTVLDELNSGPSELDELGQGDESDFANIDRVEARKPVSVTLRALNKVTAKYRDLVIDMNAMAEFGALEITPRFCDTRPPDEFPETTAFVEIVDKTAMLQSDLKIDPRKTKSEKKDKKTETALAPSPSPVVAHAEAPALAAASSAQKLPENTIFSGWMFASSPALNGVEHPVYDVWVIDCKTVAVGS